MTPEELQVLIAQGEGQRLDFKRGVSSVKDLARMVVCLANAQGDKIMLSVDDDGTVAGCASYDVPDILSGIYRATAPPITVDIEETNTPQGTVLAEMVRQGLLERVGTGKATVYQLTVETAEQIGVSLLGRLLTPAEQEARVLEHVRGAGADHQPGVSASVWVDIPPGRVPTVSHGPDRQVSPGWSKALDLLSLT